ncbi:aminotransferase class I/II-fold pyridoxal phosphate-dependent enzyme [Brevifollis gellanilyticus]|uniref:8-amino-7-oxononanoate synthase n=1 Tax=Brevifollis gellanilyticus TaxID=748831 RepID=A0A512MBA4_9BACT|nr:8-amino-7-oxononanoate synthase [Brevifollis gellanilyticus]GEP44015.1 8-amino-7-oxononanoate synthase [Brevifollis gellanilyticus]
MSWDLQPQIDDWRAQDLWRELRLVESTQGPVVKVDGKEMVNFSSNDYLGLADSEVLKQAMQEGVDFYGAGSGASRLVCGTLRPHRDLEDALAFFKRTEAALTFSSGYATAMGTIPALMGQGDTIILDKLCHASLVDASRLSGATIRVFPHNHLGKLEKLLQTATGRVLIVTESIFSMDGDRCPLVEIVALKERHGAWLMLDEAHAVGVIGPQGRGLAAELGLEGQVELQMGTLSKAIGLSGGYLAASRQVIDWLINRARSFVYSTAPPPAVAHAALVGICEILQGKDGDTRRGRLWKNLALLKSDPLPTSAIVPWIIGDEQKAMDISSQLREAGLLIPAIRYPTVARGSARLRVTCTAGHSEAQIRRLLAELAKVGLGESAAPAEA